MKVTIICKNIQVSDDFKEVVEMKIDKLDKYFATGTEAKVLLSAGKNWQKVEATIMTKGHIFRAEQMAEDLGIGLDSVVDKLSVQMSKFKTKLQKKNKEYREPEMVFDSWPEAEAEVEPEIIKTKSFAVHPMNVEEAIMQMELLGHEFFLFLNGDSGKINVVYARHDGGYGLLDPDYK